MDELNMKLKKQTGETESSYISSKSDKATGLHDVPSPNHITDAIYDEVHSLDGKMAYICSNSQNKLVTNDNANEAKSNEEILSKKEKNDDIINIDTNFNKKMEEFSPEFLVEEKETKGIDEEIKINLSGEVHSMESNDNDVDDDNDNDDGNETKCMKEITSNKEISDKISDTLPAEQITIDTNFNKKKEFSSEYLVDEQDVNGSGEESEIVDEEGEINLQESEINLQESVINLQEIEINLQEPNEMNNNESASASPNLRIQKFSTNVKETLDEQENEIDNDLLKIDDEKKTRTTSSMLFDQALLDFECELITSTAKTEE